LDDAVVAARLAEEARRQDEARVSRLLAGSGVPARYLQPLQPSCLPELVDGKPVREPYLEKLGKVRRMVAERRLVALVGPRGTGKTAISCQAVMDLCRQKQLALYCTANDYFLAIKETFGSNSSRTQTAIEEAHLRPVLLAVDGLEERGDTPWEDRMLRRLIDKRYAAMQSTILISNDDYRTFLERVGDSISSRLLDGGMVIKCEWPTLRGRINNEVKP
jgi:DNA replication protein DnaC